MMASIHQYRQRQYELIESILGNFGLIIALLITSISVTGYCNGDIHLHAYWHDESKGLVELQGYNGWGPSPP